MNRTKISRRHFLADSLFLAGSTLLPAKSLTSPFRIKNSNYHQSRKPEDYPSYLALAREGILAERVKKLYAVYENCHLCPRDCRVNRLKGQIGLCQASAKAKISSAFPHFGEEAPLVGKKGSGTVFFSNCNLRCLYCQNYTISIQGEGVEVSDRQLAETMVKVQGFGCHNINLVTPTHYLPNIIAALEIAITIGLRVPFVYNTSGYETLETLQLLDGIVDLYLPDCKYVDPAMAAKYSERAYNYPHYARLALKEMHRQVGELAIDEKGIARRGMIVRHLILPNRISGTEEFIKFVAEDLSKAMYVNLMGQYRPEYKAFEHPELARRLSRSEYNEALAWARKYGLTRLDR